jgi:hypothetical protein
MAEGRSLSQSSEQNEVNVNDNHSISSSIQNFYNASVSNLKFSVADLSFYFNKTTIQWRTVLWNDLPAYVRN